LFSHTDFMATFAALTGQSLPTDAGPDSENVLDAMIGQSTTGRSVLVTQNPIAIREGNWKLHTDNNPLYNIASDPAEASNVAASNAATRTRLQALLAAIQATPMTSPLLGWWPLDEGTGGAARDLSGMLRVGSLTGAPTWLNENSKPFLRFGGGNHDSVRIDGLPVIGGAFTIALWARSATSSFSGGGAFASRGSAFALLPLDGSRQIKFRVTTASAAQRELTYDFSGIEGFELTDWHHYGASHDPATGTLRLFVDGVERASAVHPPESLQVATGSLFLGSENGSASFAGDLSDIRLHPLALTPQRIANTASSRLDDADGDGMLSDWEHRNQLDPFDPAVSDSDGDGLPDDFEYWFIANSPDHHTLADVNPGDDPDGDGANIYQEWLAGTNPLDPNDVFRIGSWEITGDGESRDLRVTIAGRAGRSYALVESTTLEEPWTTVDSLGPLASDQTVELVWQRIPENRAFVRVRVDYTSAVPISE
jgi:hypothetical protein